MATHEAQAYKDPGTPEEQSRRTFLANVTVAIGGVIGLVGIPLVISLIPESLASPDKSAGGTWAPIAPDDFKKLQSSTEPLKIQFSFKYADGYFPPADDTQFVWAVKFTPDEEKSFRSDRPDLYTPGGKIDYEPIVAGFAMFSSVCPHLGCRYNWVADQKRFICPCHGSQFDRAGAHLAGPAPRGLDPLPVREKSGNAEVTWIQYKSGQADRVIVAYS